jgi:hypothetical protein
MEFLRIFKLNSKDPNISYGSAGTEFGITDPDSEPGGQLITDPPDQDPEHWCVYFFLKKGRILSHSWFFK